MSPILNEQGREVVHSAMRRSLHAGAASLALMIAGTPLASAQDTSGETPAVQGASNGSGDIDDQIVVSAQRREQSQVDVPISLSVFDGDFLTERNIFDVEDLGFVTPGFMYEDSLISSGARARIRGIGSPTFTSGVETSVSVVIDGVVTGPSGSGLASLFDVERVEVLRGPQGTLFGKNATAGVVNVVSRGATDEFEAYLNVQRAYDDFNDRVDFTTTRVDGAVSGPIGENTRARFAFFTRDDGDGQVRNLFRNIDEYNRSQAGARLVLDHEQGPFSADFRAQYVRTDDECCGAIFREVSDAALAFPNTPLLLSQADEYGMTIGRDNRDSIMSDRVGEEAETGHISLTMDYALGNGLTLRSITGYRNWNSFGEDDSERLAIDLADATQADIELRLITEELQLLSDGSGPFNYVLGLYFYDQRLDDRFSVGGALGTGVPGAVVSTATNEVNVRNIAAYADVTWRFAESWELLGGLRVLNEEQDINGFRVGSFFGPNRPPREESVEDTDWTGRVGIRFNPSANASYFVTATRGYKGAGIDNSNSGPFFSPLNDADPILNPETVVSFEAGAKNTFWNGRASTNIVAFYANFDDFQTSSFDGESNAFNLRNAGTIEIKGIEFDGRFRPWDGATIIAGAAWVDAIFDEFVGAPCTALQNATGSCPPEGQDISGSPVDGNPEFEFSLVGRQDFEFGSVPGWVAAEVSWRDEVQYNTDQDPLLVQDSFALANVRAGFEPFDGVELHAFVENVFNETYAQRISSAPLLPGVTNHYPGPGRMIGIGLRLSR